MAWSRDPRKPTRYMRGSKRYNDVGGHSPPGDELENTRDHERIWFELKRSRSCCDCDSPGFKYCFQTFDYPSYICEGDFPGGDTLHGYWPGVRQVSGLSDGIAGGCGSPELLNVNLFDLSGHDNGSWRNGPYVTSFGSELDLVTGNGKNWVGVFPNANWSLEFWVKPDSTDINNGDRLVRHGLPGESLSQGGLDVYLRSNGAVGLAHAQIGGGAIQESGAGWFEADQWHHVVVVRNTIAKTIAIFVNGRIAISRILPTTGWAVNTFPSSPAIVIVNQCAWADIAWYDSALSPTIIRRHYQAIYGVEGAVNPLASVDGDPGQVEDPTTVITEQISIDLIDGGGDAQAGSIPMSQGQYTAWVTQEDSPFELEVRKGQANGYASLNAGVLVPDAQLGAGSGSPSVFLRGDRVWAAIPATPPELPTDAVVGDLVRLGGDPYYKDLVVAASPYAYWPLQESVGAALCDDAIGSNDLTPSAAVALGNAGGPVARDNLWADLGAGGTLTRNVPVSLTTNWSFECWVRIDTTPPANQRVIFNYGTAGVNGFQLWVNANLKLQGICQGVAILGSSVTVLTLDVWYHVAVVRDATTFKLYINGVLDTTLGTSSMVAPTGQIRLGQGGSNAADDFQLAHASFWNRVLTVTEMAQRYNAYDAVGAVWEAVTLDDLHPSVRLTRSTDQAITTATETVVSFDTEVADTAGFHEGVTNPSRITIPTGQGGKYHVTGSVAFAPNATGLRRLSLVKNGLTGITPARRLAGQLAPGDATLATPLSVSAEVDLVDGDYIELAVYQTSGGSLDVDKDQMVAHFAATRVS